MLCAQKEQSNEGMKQYTEVELLITLNVDHNSVYNIKIGFCLNAILLSVFDNLQMKFHSSVCVENHTWYFRRNEQNKEE